METFQDYIHSHLLHWLHDNRINYSIIEVDKGALIILYSENVFLKIYDRLGHGFSATVSVAEKYDESIYENDKFSLHWAFEYFRIEQSASFDSRTEEQYRQNLPDLVADIKSIFPRLNQLTSSEWASMSEWINKEANKRFT